MLPLKLLIRAAVHLRSALLAKPVEPDSQEPLLLRRLSDNHLFLSGVDLELQFSAQPEAGTFPEGPLETVITINDTPTWRLKWGVGQVR
jgi:hypothetical protein